MSSWLLMVRDSLRAPRVVLVNAETAEAAPGAGGAADSVRDRGAPGCGPARVPAVAGAGAGGGGDGGGGSRRPAGSRVCRSRRVRLERARGNCVFVQAVSGLVPLLLADKTAERAVLVEEGHVPLEAVPGAPCAAHRGERQRDRVARVQGGSARSRLVASRTVLGQVQPLGVQIDAFGLGVLQPCLVLAVGV